MVPNSPESLEKLRESILHNGGLFTPLLYFMGYLIDGKKRRSICEEHGLTPTEHHTWEVSDAAPLLWHFHPERCAEMFPCKTITEAAELYKTDLASVAWIFRRPEPPPVRVDRQLWKKYDENREARHYNVRMPPPLWAQGSGVAKKLGWSRSYFFRVALAYAIAHPDVIRIFSRSQSKALRYRRGPKKRPPKT